MACHLGTGAAGFLGSWLSELLVEQEQTGSGVDNMNDACAVRMKECQQRKLQVQDSFTFQRLGISNNSIIESLKSFYIGFVVVINLADISKAKSLPGWEPRKELGEGMKHLVDWFRSEQDWANEAATP